MRYLSDYWIDVEKVIKCIPNLDKLYGKSILITGATGMICSSVVEILFCLNERHNAGIEIFLAGRDKKRIDNRFSSIKEMSNYRFWEYDATKENSFSLKVDYIIHGASNANPSVYIKEPVETMLANIVGVNNLLKLALECNAYKVLYLSSSEVYGNKAEICEYEENDYGFVDILNLRACYPSAKRAAETLCVSYGEEYGIETVIARPGHIYGPTILRTDTRASAQFTWSVIDGQDIIMKSAGTQIRSYCYSLDCASALLALLTSGQKGNAYNIANSKSNVSIRTLAETFAVFSGRKIFFEKPSDAEKRGYNPMMNSVLNSRKIEMLGWKACFDLNSGVQRTIQYLR